MAVPYKEDSFCFFVRFFISFVFELTSCDGRWIMLYIIILEPCKPGLVSSNVYLGINQHVYLCYWLSLLSLLFIVQVFAEYNWVMILVIVLAFINVHQFPVFSYHHIALVLSFFNSTLCYLPLKSCMHGEIKVSFENSYQFLFPQMCLNHLIYAFNNAVHLAFCS